MAALTRDVVPTADGVIRHGDTDDEVVSDGKWDGRGHSYIPRYPLPVDDRVLLHEDFDRDVDPITYKVLRSRFWTQNLEHGDVLKRVSGSLAVVESHD
jgi:N-methylhydantoinase B